MLDIFQYEFMRRAFIVGGILAIILPCMGQSILIKRLSTIGDTLSHSSLAGLTIGLAFGFNPLSTAIISCIVAGVLIEFIRNKLKNYQEVSTVIILAASIGLAGIFSSLVENTNSISSYLFGSIVTISDGEFYLVLAIASIVLLCYGLLYKKLYLSVFDPQAARIMGINTSFINFMLTILTAITVSISARTIGSLIVSSLLVIPSLTAIELKKTYKASLIVSIILSLVYVYLGLLLSYHFNLRPGSVIVLISVVCLLIIMLVKNK